MKISKLVMLLLCLCVLFQCVPNANAAAPIENKDVSLTVSYKDGEIPLVDAIFRLYRIAEVDSHGQLTPVAPFEAFSVDIKGEDDQSWLALIDKLEAAIQEQAIVPYAENTTDEMGKAHFPAASEKLEQGLYLVMGDWHIQNECIYETTPFLVMLPALDPVEDVWEYDVAVNSKHSSIPLGELIEYRVQKLWEDAGHESERPREIAVDLLRNGELWETVTLSKGKWEYTWLELDPDAVWTVKEHSVKDYLSEVSREGNTFYVKNTYSPRLPQTGQLNWPVPVLAIAGLAFVAVGLGMYCSGKKERR